MRLYLMRHGVAVDRADPACPPDPERPLTHAGRDRTRAAARGLRALGVSPARALTSPYRRARQTAALTLAALSIPPDGLEETPLLLPDADPAELLPLLAGPDAICFGHAPHLDALVAMLVGAPVPFTSLKKAGVAVLVGEARPGGAELEAVYPPRVLRRLGD
jgi:phosphohistidine phosphatase